MVTKKPKHGPEALEAKARASLGAVPRPATVFDGRPTYDEPDTPQHREWTRKLPPEPGEAAVTPTRLPT